MKEGISAIDAESFKLSKVTINHDPTKTTFYILKTEKYIIY